MSAYSDAILALTPKAYWRLGESAGTTAVDETGNYNGTIVGTPTLGVAGLVYGDTDTAIRFNKLSSEDITLPNTAAATTLRTICFTFSPTVTMNSGNSDFNYPLYRYQNGFNYFGFAIYQGELRFYHNDGINGATSIVANSTSWAAGEKYHIVARLDSTAGIQLYVNGAVQADTNSRTTGTTTSAPTIGAFYIGSHGNGSGYFDGIIDEVALFTASLTPTQIADLASLFFPPPAGNANASGGISGIAASPSAGFLTASLPNTYYHLVMRGAPSAYWRLADTGSTALDALSTFNGAYHGSPTQQVAGLVSNDNNQAVLLNGTSQYIDTDFSLANIGLADFALQALVSCNTVTVLQSIMAWTVASGALDTNDPAVHLSVNTSGQLVFSIRQSSSSQASVISAVTLNSAETYHLLAQRTGGTLELWVDGYKDANTTDASAVSIGGAISAHKFNLGYNSEGSGQSYFGGTLDEVSVYLQSFDRHTIAFMSAMAHNDVYWRFLQRNWDFGFNAAIPKPSVYLRLGDYSNVLRDEIGVVDQTQETTVSGALTRVAGLASTGKNKAFLFSDGNYVRIRTDNTITTPAAIPPGPGDGGQAFSIAFLFKATGGTPEGTLFHIGTYSNQGAVSLHLSSNGNLYVRSDSNNCGYWSAAQLTDNGLLDGNAHHVVITFGLGLQVVNSVRMYVDGRYTGTEFHTTTYCTGDQNAVLQVNFNDYAALGAQLNTFNNPQAGYYLVNAVIDEFAIFDHLVTDASEQLYQAALLGVYPGVATGGVVSLAVTPPAATASVNTGAAALASISLVTVAATAFITTTGSGGMPAITAATLTAYASSSTTANTALPVSLSLSVLGATPSVDTSGVSGFQPVSASITGAVSTGDATTSAIITPINTSFVIGTAYSVGTAPAQLTQLALSIVEATATGGCSVAVADMPVVQTVPVEGSPGAAVLVTSALIPVSLGILQAMGGTNTIPRDTVHFKTILQRRLADSVYVSVQANPVVMIQQSMRTVCAVTTVRHCQSNISTIIKKKVAL